MFTINSVRRKALQRWSCLSGGGEDGFSLLEVMISLGIFSVLMGLTMNYGTAWLNRAALEGTSVRWMGDMRFAQESAISSGHAWSVTMSKYTPEYTVSDGGTILYRLGFAGGVNYGGGYLPMSSGRVTYDTLGGAQTSGIIHLVNGSQVETIRLYMGAGLQTLETGQ